MSKRDMPSSGNNEWETPPEIFQHWDDRFRFICDVAASKENHKGLSRFITKEEDALAPETVWEGRNWLNPPYGRGMILPFVKQAALLGIMQGKLTCALLPVATSTRWWQECVTKADHVFFYPHRINFLRDGQVVHGVAFDPCIVIWGAASVKITVEPLLSVGSVRIIIDCPEAWLDEKCERLPIEIAEQITLSQGIGIIEDAVITAMGYTRKNIKKG